MSVSRRYKLSLRGENVVDTLWTAAASYNRHRHTGQRARLLLFSACVTLFGHRAEKETPDPRKISREVIILT